MRRRFSIAIPFLAALLAVSAKSAWACSTCSGDPDNPMSHGVVMGVWFMVGIVGVVLTGIAGTGLFWLHRSRRIARRESSPVAGSP